MTGTKVSSLLFTIFFKFRCKYYKASDICIYGILSKLAKASRTKHLQERIRVRNHLEQGRHRHRPPTSSSSYESSCRRKFLSVELRFDF